jgi:hypothetical protein
MDRSTIRPPSATGRPSTAMAAAYPDLQAGDTAVPQRANTSAVLAQLAMTASFRSTIAFHTARAAWYPSSPGSGTIPSKPSRSRLVIVSLLPDDVAASCCAARGRCGSSAAVLRADARRCGAGPAAGLLVIPFLARRSGRAGARSVLPHLPLWMLECGASRSSLKSDQTFLSGPWEHCGVRTA